MRFVLLLPFLILLQLTQPALAADLVFYLEDEPIYTSSNPERPGLLNELMDAMLSESHLQTETRYLPWGRAQLMAQSDPRAVIFPLARTQTRENQYKWYCQVLEVPVMFISLEGHPVIHRYEEARHSRGIGVIKGTPQEEKLQELGIPYVSYSGEDLYLALKEEQIHTVFTAAPEANYGWRQLGIDRKLQYGNVQMFLLLWIAGHRDNQVLSAGEWSQLLNRVKLSGVYGEIRDRYFFRQDATGSDHQTESP